MRKTKILLAIILVSIVLLIIPNVSNAAVEVTRNVYSNNGSMKFNFTGLTLDTTKEYEFGLTKTAAAEVGTWHLITEYTENTATVDIVMNTEDLRDVVDTTNTAYIRIREKSVDTLVLEPYAVDVKTPFLKVTNFTVMNNGKEWASLPDNELMQVALRNAENSKAYYQYEKITDENIISKYKEIKSANGNFEELQSLLKTTVPTSGWNSWLYWNGHGSRNTAGFGYTQKTIQVPDTGLYYMWVYFSGDNLKDVYGYILVDNLVPDVALESISLPKTETVELGKTLTLEVTFNPTTATNKIVTWSSSDESVATVDNNGEITPKKVGSTIITVTSQDGGKKATCTVTVTEAGNSNENNNNDKNQNNNNNNNSNNNNNNKNNNNGTKDPTVADSKIPQTGVGIGLTVAIISVLGIGAFALMKYRKLRDVK